jgi:hypothetical protein
MEIGAIFLILALALLVGLFISRPFFRSLIAAAGSAQPASDPLEHRRSALMAERDRLLTALQELDFDNALGKIPAEDYPQQRAALLQRAAAALRQLDELQGAEDAEAAQAMQTAEERVEQAVAVRRADSAALPGQAGNGDELEALIAARRKERQEKSAGFCPKCGRAVTRSDKFCSRCGAIL